ncbi:unnamed protein product [Miscanthus lutarioriparius]|uniref:Uncharacterized protein n=1 Tax=Miscanthus lutarioriparius TaxID=422564 RepID=A0A811MVD7_9POAL|nr:unnamed protein product [Miscanthus lutarioriparius]
MRRRKLGARARLSSSLTSSGICIGDLSARLLRPACVRRVQEREPGGLLAVLGRSGRRSRETERSKEPHRMGQCASRPEPAAGGVGGDGRRGCLAVARGQRSRFYIFRRCVAMLICWHKYKKI